MSNKVYPFIYDRQFEKAIGQFMRVLAGFQYFTGRKDTGGQPVYEKVPVRYGKMDRIVASIFSNRDTQHNNRKLPAIAVAMTGIAEEPDKRRARSNRDEISTAGYEDQRRVVYRKIGGSFALSLEASIIASSKSELLSILEQILLVFNPRVTVKLDSSALTPDNTTEISLVGIQDEIGYPLGTEQPLVNYTLNFEMPVRLRYPINDDGNFMDELINGISTSSDGTPENVDSEGINDSISYDDLTGGTP
tara:strand:+ start:112 stop:855 length:744 start_codon:yes stop_codon:yes gene_type:complete